LGLHGEGTERIEVKADQAPSTTIFIIDDDAVSSGRLRAHFSAALPHVDLAVWPSLAAAAEGLGQKQPECIVVAEHLLDGSGRSLLELLTAASDKAPPLIVATAESERRWAIRSLSSIAWEYDAVSGRADSTPARDLTRMVGEVLERRGRRRDEVRRAYAERLGTLRRMFGRAAHEINNPAAIIRLALSAVREAVEPHRADGEQELSRTLSADEVTRLHELVQSAEDALGRITAGLRELESRAGLALGHQSSVTMNEVARAVEARVLEEARTSEVEILFEYGAEESFFGDRDQLGNLIQDLLDNAIEAAGENGRVRVITGVEGGQALLTVEDSGEGVDSELVEDIFEPLFSTRFDRGALGMGLSRVWGIVERHGGTITVERSPLGGAKFVVLLPLDQGAEPLSVVSSQLVPSSRTEREERILIVDDEPQILASYSRVLRQRYEVDVAPSSQAALKLIRERSYALILCDVIMPGEDGVRFAERLLSDHPEQANVLLFCTGGVLEAPQERFLTMWENGFLKKPMSADELLNSVSVFIESKSDLPLELELPAS
jgi:signal transduction histidine kinase